MNDQSKYEETKENNKQKSVRNEFLYHGKSDGKYDFPIIKKQNIDISKIKFLSYCDTTPNDADNRDKTVHFFTHDWKFDKVYDDAEKEADKLSGYYCLLSPDFSLFTDMPLALQIESVFKNRWCGAYWQSKGLRVIPTVAWGDERTFDFCFDGIEEGSIVAVSTYYRENCEHDFMPGYNAMLKKIKPSVIICYDEPFDSMMGNIISFLPTTYEWTKNLSSEDFARFQWEKHHKNIMGLDPSQFRYFRYEDPHAKIDIKPCAVCGRPVAIDKFGIGECSCGWIQNPQVTDPDEVMYPNLTSLNKAKNLYFAGKKITPDFESFVDALYMYSEMLFKYDGVTYEVFIRQDEVIVFCSENMQQEYDSREKFMAFASIGGVLLKDLWSGVTEPSYMY